MNQTDGDGGRKNVDTIGIRPSALLYILVGALSATVVILSITVLLLFGQISRLDNKIDEYMIHRPKEGKLIRGA